MATNLNEFNQIRVKAAKDVQNKREPEIPEYYSEYARLTRTSSDDANVIMRRHAFFVQEMLKFLSPTKKDERRTFTDLERRTVFIGTENVNGVR